MKHLETSGQQNHEEKVRFPNSVRPGSLKKASSSFLSPEKVAVNPNFASIF